MNTPPNTKPFSLELAKQNHPLITQGGTPVKFVAHVPEAVKSDQLIVLINGTVYGYHDNGMWRNIPDEDQNLFLAPLGMCEGKPVFAGDKLVHRWTGDEIIAVEEHHDFEVIKWPSKVPVVETKYSQKQLYDLFYSVDDTIYTSLKRIADKAIERCIADGDCLPTASFVSLACSVYDRWLSSNLSFEDIAQNVLNDYLEGLK